MQVSKEACFLEEGRPVAMARFPQHHEPRVADRGTDRSEVGEIVGGPVGAEPMAARQGRRAGRQEQTRSRPRCSHVVPVAK